MNRNVQAIAALFDAGRICLTEADLSLRNVLVRDLENAGEPVLRLRLPKPDLFRRFLNSALTLICDSTHFSNRYPGIVMAELDDETYLENKVMVLALLELLDTVTARRLILAGKSKGLLALLAGCTARFAVPGFLKVEEMPHRGIVLEIAKRLDIRFDSEMTEKRAVSLFAELCGRPAFHPDGLLRALCEPGTDLITADSLARETDDCRGYVAVCRETEQRQIKHNETRIGFQTDTNRNREGGSLHVV